MAIVGANWSYSGNPSASTKDQVRFLVGDTDTNNQMLSDEEIDWALTQYAAPNACAVFLIDRILISGKLVDRKIGDLEISASQQAEQLLAVKRSLKSGASSGALPYAGGISESDRESYKDNTDTVEAPHWEGQFDNPAANLAGSGDGYLDGGTRD